MPATRQPNVLAALLQQAASPAAGSISFGSLVPPATGVPELRLLLSGSTANTRSAAGRGSRGRGSGAESATSPAAFTGGASAGAAVSAAAAAAAASMGQRPSGAVAMAGLAGLVDQVAVSTLLCIM